MGWKIVPNYCCCSCCRAYLSSYHRTASDDIDWMIHAFLIAVATSWLEESVPAQEFLVIQCSCEFLRIFVH